MASSITSQPTIIVVQSPQKEQSILSRAIGSAMVPVTGLACVIGFGASILEGKGTTEAVVTALACGIVMSVATLALQKSADVLVDITIFMIKLPIRVILYPFTSQDRQVQDLANQIIS